MAHLRKLLLFLAFVSLSSAAIQCDTGSATPVDQVMLFINYWNQNDPGTYGAACSAIYDSLKTHAEGGGTVTTEWKELQLHVGPWTVNRDVAVDELVSFPSKYTQVWVCDLSDRGPYSNYDGHTTLANAIASWRSNTQAPVILDGRLVDHVANPTVSLLTTFYDAFATQNQGLYIGTGGEEFFQNVPEGSSAGVMTKLGFAPFVASSDVSTSGFNTDTANDMISAFGASVTTHQAAKPVVPTGLQGQPFSGTVLYPLMYKASDLESLISTTIPGSVGFQATINFAGGCSDQVNGDPLSFSVTYSNDPGNNKNCSWVEFIDGVGTEIDEGNCNPTFRFTTSGSRILRVRAIDSPRTSNAVYAEDFILVTIAEVKPTAFSAAISVNEAALGIGTFFCQPNSPGDPHPMQFSNFNVPPTKGRLIFEPYEDREPPEQELVGGRYNVTVGFVADFCTEGTDTLDYVCANDLGVSDPATVTITITPFPDPVADTLSIDARQFADASGQLSGETFNGAGITFAIDTPPANGIVDLGANGTFVYSAVSAYLGNDPFTYTVSDGCRTSAATTVNVNIVGNQKPVPASYTNFTVPVNAPFSAPLVGTDADGDPVYFSIGTQVSFGSVSVDSDSGIFTLNPGYNYIGPDRFFYRVNDGFEDSESNGLVELNIVNVPPRFDQDAMPFPVEYASTVGATVTGQVHAVDPDFNQTLTYSILIQSKLGTVTMNSTGYFSYTSENGYSDEFFFVVSDGIEESAPASVVITMEQPGAAPAEEAPKLSAGATAGIAVAGVVFGCCCLAAIANFAYRTIKLRNLKREIAKYEEVNQGDPMDNFNRH